MLLDQCTARLEAEAPPTIEVENSSDRARDREIAAYLSAASFPADLPSGPGPQPVLNADRTLNALVQLGAHRLGCDRAFLSFIDRKYQYVVAEMTRTVWLGEMRCPPDQMPFLGVCKLDACWGVCPTTMKAFMDEKGEWVQTGPNVIANRTRYIINDFRTDPDYNTRSYVTNYPYFVSYLEVPLVSPLGYLLGSYCVVHNDLKDYDNDETVGIMDEIAAAIMAHLENVRLKQHRHRAEQLIDGLSQFIRREPSLRKLSHASPPPRTAQHDGITARLADDPGRPPPPPNLASASSIQSSVTLSSASRRDSTGTPLSSLPDVSDEDPMEQQRVMGDTAADANAPVPSSPTSGSEPSEVPTNGFISSANIKSVFFRAADTIRWSMNMDGLMFLDAVPSTYTDRSDQPSLGTDADSARDDVVGPFCAAIVQSAAGPGGETVMQSSQTRLPEVVLQRFIRRYPQGHIFSADEFGPIDESYAPGKPFQSGHSTDRGSRRLRQDVAKLFRVLPAAKYVIFHPLWHFQRECWYAAALGWVADPTRAIDITDISLVSAFGSSVMAEVLHLEALAASRAKSDFVSSLSHELRSPLHGILASSELLRETISDPSMLSILDMIDSCGTTLLDTFNHLLDHAIIISAGKRSNKTQTTDLQIIDLGELVEEVVEVVKTSHTSESASLSSMHPKELYSAEPFNAGKNLPDSSLLVTLDIGRIPSWKMPLDAGCWKRIVMNIFGNALKYTRSGRIEVALKIVQRTDRVGKLRDHVSFSVEDTGSGMSSDYLKYHLFTPFSQEHSHFPGMGLGLSIVQQLASGLGGTVHVKSSVGIGTLVEILIPFNQNAIASGCNVQPTTGTTPQSYNDDHQHLSGRTACLITPEAYIAMINKGLEVTPEMRNRSGVVERALRVNAGEALGMKILLGTADCPTPDADIYILDSTLPSETVAGRLEAYLPPEHSTRAVPLVLLCSGAGSPTCLKQEMMKRHHIHLHHPIGPRKVEMVLSSALKSDFQGASREYHIAVRGGALATADPYISLPPLAALPSRVEELPTYQGQHQDHQASEAQESPEESTAAVTTSQTKTFHLLLVDDNPINIKLLTTVVRKMNHTFATACHGLEAVQLYRDSLKQRRPFDMVFMDISMPVMDGFEATREIRQLESEAQMQRCKIVALTGLSGELSRNEAFASGCDDFLTKPVKLDMVRRLLD